MPSNIATMSISLPKEMRENIKQRIKLDHYSTPSDYIRSLIRADLKRFDEERLEAALLDGVDSGNGVRYGTKDWDVFKTSLHERINKVARKKRSQKRSK